MQILFNQLRAVSPETAEPTYQKFYPACAEAKLAAHQAQNLYDRIQALYAATKSPTVQSYCLLYFGAVVDTRALNVKTLGQLATFLDNFLADQKTTELKTTTGFIFIF